ncbi:MAG: FAD-binding protein [Phycisphaerales bacterium]|nr:MAG: FAD-binding protein [Phycisphaerales bacterium]
MADDHQAALPSGPAGLDDRRLRAIAGDLSSLIKGEVRFGRHDRMLYATDASMYQVEPIGVVIPQGINDAEAVVRYCAGNGLPVLPRGGGTSLAGQAVNAAVVIDFSRRCRKVREVDAGGVAARVEPGLVLDEFNITLKPHRLMFGPDVATSSHACLGGMIGNNSAGAHSILYGRTVDHILALDVLMSDGTRLAFDEGAAARNGRVREITDQVAEIALPLRDQIRKRFPKTLRRVNGYNLDLLLDQLEASTPGTFDKVNLAHLICGAEGTLGVVVEAKLKLVSAPNCKGLSIVPFGSVSEALQVVAPILQTGPAAVELIDDVVLDLAMRNPECRRYADLLPRSSDKPARTVLYVEYFADDEEELRDRMGALTDRFDADSVRQYVDAISMDRAWKLRKAGEPLLHGLPGLRKPIAFVEDTAVNPEHLPAFIERFRRIVDSHGTKAAYYAHASVGCLHVRPLICLRDGDDRRMMEEIAAEVTDLVVEYGGALSGEHGDGRLRSHLLDRFYGRDICEAFRKIKAVFDPMNLLNPGNIVGPRPMAAHLRVLPHQEMIQVPGVETFYRYEAEHGFAEAVELCNGAGTCRRMEGGTMCPSYRTTRDERHASRGRGNALRLAITGQLSPDGTSPLWNDPQTRQTLDLCLSCKACKSECPSNVDIAKLKAEFTAQAYRAAGGPPLRKRLIGRTRTLGRVGSMFHPVFNLAGRVAPVRAAVNLAMGFDRRRRLPAFGPSLYRWFARHGSKVKTDGPTVVLLPDCFTVYYEPQIGRAAVRVLEALGYRVILPRMGCCGRSLISQGMLAEAVRVCRESAEALMRSVEESGAGAVAACEPSCASAVVDDWVDLKLGLDTARLRDLAARTSLIEDFIESRWDDHTSRPQVGSALNGPILLHGHCHQKALGDAEGSANLLRRVFGDRVWLLDSGCCGMAGAFGYEKEHYDLSLAIGEISLFGPIRENPQAVIAAPGISCRQQIRDGTGRAAMHPIEAFANAILG